MVACKNNPGQDKDYQKQDYRLSASITGTRYNPAENDGIDRIVQPAISNKLYQKRIEPLRVVKEYDLLQPVWFDEIIKRLANDNPKETEKQKKYHNRPYYSLN